MERDAILAVAEVVNVEDGKVTRLDNETTFFETTGTNMSEENPTERQSQIVEVPHDSPYYNEVWLGSGSFLDGLRRSTLGSRGGSKKPKEEQPPQEGQEDQEQLLKRLDDGLRASFKEREMEVRGGESSGTTEQQASD